MWTCEFRFAPSIWIRREGGREGGEGRATFVRTHAHPLPILPEALRLLPLPPSRRLLLLLLLCRLARRHLGWIHIQAMLIRGGLQDPSFPPSLLPSLLPSLPRLRLGCGLPQSDGSLDCLCCPVLGEETDTLTVILHILWRGGGREGGREGG